MKNSSGLLFCLALVASLIGCSGGGGGSAASASVALSGKVIDGPISGATVCLDVNSNNACDTGEPTATTNATGNYTLPSYAGSLDGLHILSVVPVGAIDLDTNTPVATGYVLMTPASNPSAVTPLTTLVSTQMLANPSLTATQAEQATLVSNNLAKQTSAILDVDVTTDSNLHKVAQAVVGAIAQTSSVLSGNSTFTNAVSSSNYGTTDSLAATQAVRLTQSMLLQQMQNSDGGINSSFHSNGALNTSAINTLANNTVNDAINYIAATTRAGKSTKVDLAAALDAGITGFKIAGGGYYLDSNNSVQSIGQRHYKVERMSTVSGKNGQLRNISGTWRKSSLNNYDLIAGIWVAEYSNAAGTVTSAQNPPVVSGNCFTAAQTPNGINLTACGMAVDLAGKKLSDFNFDCKDATRASISGCDVNAVFPAGSIGYNFQVLYDEDQYQLEIPVNGTPIAAGITSLISTYTNVGGPYQYFGASKVAMNIASYDSVTKTGVFNWYDNSSGSFAAVAETSPFSVATKDGVDVLTGNLPNLYYRLGGGSDQTVLFSYAPAGTNTGSQAGVFRGNKYSSKLATNIYFGMTEQNMMNSIAYNFVASEYALPNLP